MKGAGSLLLFSFLIFGILLNTAMLLADDNSSGSGNDSNSTANSINSSDDDNNQNQTQMGDDDDHENETEVGDDGEDENDDNSCHEISGKTFRSVTQHETGLEPNRTTTSGYWTIGFKEGRFVWHHSDVVEEGSYTCANGSIVGTSKIGNNLTGQFDKKAGVLVWDGVEYSKAGENKTKVKTKEVVTRGNCTIKIEKTIKVEEGKRVETTKRKIKCADGTEAEVKIKVENKTDDKGRIREKIKYEFKGREIDVDTEDGIDLKEETNTTEYRLKAIFRGNITDIKIMPDEAAEIALERLKALNLTNFTVDLREGNHNNIPKVVYNVETNKHGRFLGVFKLKLKMRGEVDPVTGEFLGTSKPWWAFLVFGEDSEQSDDGNGGNGSVNSTDNETVNTTTPIIGFNETINGTFNASA